MIKGIDDLPVYSASTVDEFEGFELLVESSVNSLEAAVSVTLSVCATGGVSTDG
jgi:hypothetical protein